MKYTKDDLIRELNAIQRQRRESWKIVWQTKDQFVEPVQQKAYDKMAAVIDVLQVMTDAEFSIFQKKAADSTVESAVVQQSLF